MFAIFVKEFKTGVMTIKEKVEVLDGLRWNEVLTLEHLKMALDVLESSLKELTKKGVVVFDKYGNTKKGGGYMKNYFMSFEIITEFLRNNPYFDKMNEEHGLTNTQFEALSYFSGMEFKKNEWYDY